MGPLAARHLGAEGAAGPGHVAAAQAGLAALGVVAGVLGEGVGAGLAVGRVRGGVLGRGRAQRGGAGAAGHHEADDRAEAGEERRGRGAGERADGHGQDVADQATDDGHQDDNHALAALARGAGAVGLAHRGPPHCCGAAGAA